MLKKSIKKLQIFQNKKNRNQKSTESKNNKQDIIINNSDIEKLKVWAYC